MKYLLTILVVGLAVHSHGQKLTELHQRLKFLEDRRDFQHDTTGFSTLPRFDNFCDNDNSTESDYYHVADLNSDGIKDLIYSGPCKPYGQTRVFLNTGKSFKKAYSFPGQLVSLEDKSGVTVMNILKEACCCDYYSEFIQVTIDGASNVTKNIIAFAAKTKIKLNTKPKVVKVVGVIRTTPEVNDTNKKDSCRNQILKGNHVTRIHKFTDIIQLSEVGPWWLVLYQQNHERSWIGWMKMSK
jgi:hypothetical protein